MTPVVLWLLFLSMTDTSLSAPTKNEDPTSDKARNIPKDLPRPKSDPGTYIFRGDLVIVNATSKNADPCVTKGCLWPKKGPHVTVPYSISEVYTEEEQTIILEGLLSIEQETCIRFVPHEDEKDYIHFESEDGCWSLLGRQDGGQYISLEKDGCLDHATVQHEVLHALGFNHEQDRSDRDDHIVIMTDNIEPEDIYNFEKAETNNLGTPYDFKSIMQYGRYDFSTNGLPVMVAKLNFEYDWGEPTEMSGYDILRINKLYGCCYDEPKESAP